MADKAFMSFTQNGEQVGLEHSLLVGGDTMEYRALVSDVAKKIIEDYAGSTLAGSAQSVQAALAALNSKKYELGSTPGNFLNNNDDLNQFYTPGNFACKTNVTASSLSNCPTTSAFKLIVEYATGNGTPCQTIIEYNTGTRYYRYTTKADGTGWSPWYKFEGTRVS